MQRKQQIDAFGASVLVAFSALLGLNQVMIKIVNAGLQPVFQAGLRSFCAFFPVLLFAMLARKKLSISDGSFWPGMLAGLLFAIEFLIVFIGLDYTSVSRASVLFYTMPLWVALAAHFLLPGESLTSRRFLGILLAIVGVAVALLFKSGVVGEKVWLGDLLCLAGSFFWAAIALLARASKFSRARPEMQLLYQLGVSAPILLLASFWFGDLLREPDPLIWFIFSFQVLVVVAIGFLAWFWVLSIYPASDMAVFSFLAPVFGVFFGWLILDEIVGWNILLALILVSVGIALVNMPSAERKTGGS